MRPATALASLTPGSGIPPPFDHLADRDLGLIRRHGGLLLGEDATRFRYGKSGDGPGVGPEPAT